MTIRYSDYFTSDSLQDIKIYTPVDINENAYNRPRDTVTNIAKITHKRIRLFKQNGPHNFFFFQFHQSTLFGYDIFFGVF
jgi:hypothetical protein